MTIQSAMPVAMMNASVSGCLFTTHTTFGTPLDITLDELSIELFYAADSASRVLLEQIAT